MLPTLLITPLRGVLLGLSIAAPVGPIGVLCIRRTLAEGQWRGFITGMGAATADATYGAVAAFGLTAITAFLLRQQIWVHVIGGVLLAYIGIRTMLSPPATSAAQVRGGGANAFLSTLLLTLTNPATILSFIAIFAGTGLITAATEWWAAALLVLGVFVGSGLWWLLLSTVISIFRERFDGRALRWVNRISGLLLLVFAAFALLSLFA